MVGVGVLHYALLHYVYLRSLREQMTKAGVPLTPLYYSHSPQNTNSLKLKQDTCAGFLSFKQRSCEKHVCTLAGGYQHNAIQRSCLDK